MKTRTPIKQENLSLQHNDEVMKTREVLFFPLLCCRPCLYLDVQSVFSLFRAVYTVYSSACC